MSIWMYATALTAASIATQPPISSTALKQGAAGYSDVYRARMNTVYGPTGLIVVPTAYTTRPDRVSFAMTMGKDRSVTGNYGLTRSIEVGGTYLEREGRSGKALANAKINIVPSNLANFQLGIGVIDAVDAVDQSYYIVASGDFTRPDSLPDEFQGIRVHAGVGSGIFRDKLIGGAELVFNPKLSLLGEYDGRDGNFAVRYVRDDAFRLQLGVRKKGVVLSAGYVFNF